ncbi:hypothetical protein ACO0QE_000314 [Hanseniaspora vineae]
MLESKEKISVESTENGPVEAAKNEQVEVTEKIPAVTSSSRPLDPQEKKELRDLYINKNKQLLTAYGPKPDGMSKSQWKKICKRKQWESEKDVYREQLRQKRMEKRHARKSKIQEYLQKGEPIPDHLKRKTRRPAVEQQDSGMKIIMDCAFDELMNDKEIISMSNQITRSYSANRNFSYFADIEIASFNKRLKQRFEGKLANTRFMEWKNVKFVENDTVKELSAEDKLNTVYLSADATETLETLESGKTYVVGGIVDKGRYKKLCLNKAEELQIPTKKLPIDEFIKINGRQVLTTTHVIELMLRYFESKDWKVAFEQVLPARKLGQEDAAEDDEEEVAEEVEEEVEEEDDSAKEA